MNNKLTELVALSVVAKPLANGVYGGCDDLQPVIPLLARGTCSVQKHLVSLYGDEPFTAAEKIINRCESTGVRVVTFHDPSYPELLKEIHMPPPVLYCKGTIPSGRKISVVGTRKSDRYSEEVTRKVADGLAAAGISVVSGLAMGIDRKAHEGALDAGGSTIAVLPQGIDMVYPAANTDIYRRIAASEISCIVSEYPPGVRNGDGWTFARRNRIISGMSEAVVITMAPLKSGAMITARYALEQNRDLYACPGNAFSESYAGCHRLIKQGAVILYDLDEFLNEIDPLFPAMKMRNPGASGSQADIDLPGDGTLVRAVLDTAGTSWTDIDTVIRKLQKPAEQVNMAVTELEISGILVRMGNRVRRV